jgi:hypothetical protein
MASRAVTQFRNLIPESAFAEASRVAEAFRLSAPDLRAFDSTIITSQLGRHTDGIHRDSSVSGPRYCIRSEADVEDVEAFVAQANAVTASAPAEARAAMNVYVKFLCGGYSACSLRIR